MSSNHPARCVQHGLVVAPDGLCVLCRRQAAGAPGPDAVAPEVAHVAPIQPGARPPAGGAGLGVIGLSALLLMAAAGAAWGWKYASGMLRSGGQLASSTAQPVAPRALAAEPSVQEQSALDQAKARDLAASLKMLEDAEAERQAREQLQQAQAAERRNTADATRQQEERDRDAARHKSVMRDLEQLGLEQARRDVQISMYSTDWCGVCTRARDYMRSRNISFKDFDVDRDAAARERARALNPGGGVPTIAIDRELLIGFSPESLEDRIARAARKRKR